MYLYEKNNNDINIYNMFPNLEMLYCYRKEMMSKMGDNYLYDGLEILNNDNEKPLFELYESELDNIILPIEKVNSKYNDDYDRNHELVMSDKSFYKKGEILTKYFYNTYRNNNVVKIQDLNKLRYFILTNKQYLTDENNKLLKVMSDIIEIPENLYVLHMLEQNKFDLINNYNYEEQLKFFNLKYIDKINFDDLRRLEWFGIGKNLYDNALKLSEQDEKVIKILKQK